MHAAEHTQTQAQIATQERSTARALLIAEYRAKVADAKRNAPKEELVARLAALRIEYLAALAAISTKIRQQARERRRAALMALVARQKQERLAAASRNL
jgi:hypothetical protein